jgi:hypothetical protein
MNALTVNYQIEFRCGRKTRKELRDRSAPDATPSGKVPRVSRIMALAIHLEQLVCSGQVKDYAELARLGKVHRSRITQITKLLYLAPDIQEAVLFLPEIVSGRDPILEHQLRAIAATIDWRRQRRMWGETLSPGPPPACLQRR